MYVHWLHEKGWTNSRAMSLLLSSTSSDMTFPKFGVQITTLLTKIIYFMGMDHGSFEHLLL